MDSSRNDSASANHLAFTSLKKLFKEQNSVLICSSLSVFVAMPINPHIRICLSSLHSPAASISRHSSKLNPNLVSSRAMCNCSRQLTVFPALAACLSTSANSFVGVYAMNQRYVRNDIILFCLFCRCPMKCHSMSLGRLSYLAVISCTLLSPNTRWPARYASSIASLGEIWKQPPAVPFQAVRSVLVLNSLQSSFF